jgi:diaminobutyrate-2-oxoglutarate transaminase
VSEDKSLGGKISAKAFARGVILETSGGNDEVLKFLPSLTISEEQLLEGLGVVESSVAELLGQPEVRARKVRLAWFKGGRQA